MNKKSRLSESAFFVHYHQNIEHLRENDNIQCPKIMNLLPCCGYFFVLPAILLDESKL